MSPSRPCSRAGSRIRLDSGDIEPKHSYDTFGAATHPLGSSPSQRLFTGEQVDVALVLDLAHQPRAELVVGEYVALVGREGGAGAVEEVEDCAVLEVDEDVPASAETYLPLSSIAVTL